MDNITGSFCHREQSFPIKNSKSVRVSQRLQNTKKNLIGTNPTNAVFNTKR